MLYTKIKAYNVGLVFENGAYKRMITEGSNWLGWSENVEIYDMTKIFVAPCSLNILLKDEAFVKAIELVDVKDNEIALQFENGVFKNVMTSGRYVYWKGILDMKFIVADLNTIDISSEIEAGLLARKELLNYLRVYSVESYEKGLLFLNGKFEKALDSGVYFYWKNTIAITVLKADMRQVQMEIAGQEILTKDKAALRLNFFARYKVVEIVKALVENKEFDKQLYGLLQLALREYVGSMGLDELLEKREQVSSYVIEVVAEKARALGVELSGCGIRDIILPGEMKEIMNQVLIAEKKAQANTITRREETASTRSLLNTAKLMEENQMLFKLKEMEYVEKIAEKINSISLSGGSQVVDQLKQIFGTERSR
jgi:regulator of protease activity HflC (stomatin/prohibitin superfamily)